MSMQPPEHRTLNVAFPEPYDVNESTDRLHLGWRIVITLLLLFVMTLIGLWTTRTLVRAAPVGQSVGSPLVLAFYYTWFDEATWTYDKLPDLPAQTYVSRDRGAMARHIEQAQAAGIDAFLVAWYGPSGDTNQTEPNLSALLDEAAARNFKIGILFETDSPFFSGLDSVTAALQHAGSVHANHPAYLRVDGRPVIFFWRPHIYGVDTWRAIRAQVDPGQDTVWISEGVDTSYLSVFDGHHLYSNTWNPPTDLGYTNQKFASLVQEARAQSGAGKLWVATVMPGYDDVRIRPGHGFARARENGAYYATAWQTAMASKPNWIVITSFNEWPEGTYIEPSVAYGDLYLSLTHEWSNRFKAGGNTTPVDMAAASAAAAEAPTLTAVPAPADVTTASVPSYPAATETPTAFITATLLNVRATPELTGEIIGMVAAGEAWPIIGRDTEPTTWWQIAYGERSGWIFADYAQATGPLDVVAATRTPVISSRAVTVDIGSATHSPLDNPAYLSLRPYLSHRP